MTLSVEDRLELTSLPGRYGNAMDDRDWPTMSLIFTADAVFDVRSMGVRMEGLGVRMEGLGVRMEGLDEIVAFMNTTDIQPLGHLMTNVVIDEREGKTLVRFRGIYPIPNDDGSASPNRVIFGFYYDEMVRTAAGWRVKNRIFTRAPKDMKPTPMDLARNRGLTQLLAADRTASPSQRPTIPAE